VNETGILKKERIAESVQSVVCQNKSYGVKNQFYFSIIISPLITLNQSYNLNVIHIMYINFCIYLDIN